MIPYAHCLSVSDGPCFARIQSAGGAILCKALKVGFVGKECPFRKEKYIYTRDDLTQYERYLRGKEK